MAGVATSNVMKVFFKLEIVGVKKKSLANCANFTSLSIALGMRQTTAPDRNSLKKTTELLGQGFK